MRHSLGFADAVASMSVAPPSSWLDLGSGGGLPGLVLAWRWSESKVALLDAHGRRCDALEAAVADLGWAERVTVVRGRAEEVGRQAAWRGSQEVVVARSFAPPAVVAECAAPLLRDGGLLVVSEPPAPAERGVGEVGHSDRWPSEALAVLGLHPARYHQGEFGYQVLVQTGPSPDRYPRRTGVPAKRPLF